MANYAWNGMPRFSRIAATLVGGMVMGAMLWGSAAHAYIPEKDFLQIKGYSPEIIEATITQRYRQEWRYPPPPKRRPQEQILRNIFINDPLGNMDPFGSYRIRERQ